MQTNQALLELARLSILNTYENSFGLNKEELLKKHEILKEIRACFVTLNLDGRLRGCIGSLQAYRPLFDDIIDNARKAAFSDPRFKPLSHTEFKNVQIELSLLTPAKLLEYKNKEDLKSKVKVGTHGVIMSLDGKRATYLPQVWEQIPSFEEFFESLSKKAGFNSCILKKYPEIYLYEAIKIK